MAQYIPIRIDKKTKRKIEEQKEEPVSENEEVEGKRKKVPSRPSNRRHRIY